MYGSSLHACIPRLSISAATAGKAFVRDGGIDLGSLVPRIHESSFLYRIESNLPGILSIDQPHVYRSTDTRLKSTAAPPSRCLCGVAGRAVVAASSAFVAAAQVTTIQAGLLIMD